jgi:hypothetical protein
LWSPVPFGFGNYPREWSGALTRIRALPFRLLIPGHGAPQHDGAYVTRLRGLIEAMRAQVAPLAGQALTLDEVRRRIDVGSYGHSFAGDDPWLQLWFRNDWLRPFAESVWKEARGEPIKQGVGWALGVRNDWRRLPVHEEAR